ncbi:MAG: C-terminal binding protein [Alphaproteobacteria bacterium]|jgi:phosphoglycerate dehydrogenase-like enzyme|nr:C-terminal binding protein [Alphaproteobacteria bacterium]
MKIIIPDAQFPGAADVELEALGPGGEVEVHRVTRKADIPDESWAACDAILAWQDIWVDPPLLEKLEKCRIVVRCGIGYDRMDLAACGARGIPVCNVPTYDFTDVMSSTLAMSLALMRGLFTYDRALRPDMAKGWDWTLAPEMRRVREQNFAVIGCGRIGTGVLLRAKGFGMTPGYYDPYLPTGHDNSLGVRRFPSLDEMLAWANVVSIHTPLNDETRNMINRETIASMKPGTIFVNCARGGLVDLDGLEWGLRDGPLAAAALDVFAEEPPASHPLMTAWLEEEEWLRGRLCITPHCSFYSEATFAEIRHGAAATAAAYLQGGSLINCVNEAFLAGHR